MLPQNLGDGEGKVGGGGRGWKLTCEVEADDFGCKEGQGLAEHSGFGFDSAHAPTDDPKAIDHGGVRVGTNKGVGVCEKRAIGLFLGEDAPSEVLQVNLVDDADSWGDHSESFEGLLTPFEELVAFAVPFEFILHIQHEGLLGAVDINLDGVIDHEINGNEGFDEFGIFFESSDGIAHGGEINQKRHACKILQDDTGNGEGNLFGGGLLGIPAGEIFHIPWARGKAVAMSENGFQNDAQGDGEAGEVEL